MLPPTRRGLLQSVLMGVAAPLSERDAVRASGQAGGKLRLPPILRARRLTPDRVFEPHPVRVIRVPLEVLLPRVRAGGIAVHRLQLAVAGDLTGKRAARTQGHHAATEPAATNRCFTRSPLNRLIAACPGRPRPTPDAPAPPPPRRMF